MAFQKESGESTKSFRARLTTLDRMVELLQAFSVEESQWDLKDLSARLEWDKATTLRFLSKLVELGFLERDEQSNYRYGPYCLELSAIYIGSNEARRDLVNIVTEIADRTRVTTQAGYLDRGEVVIAVSQEGSSPIKAAASLGDRLPVHGTAIGKAILSQMSNDEIRELLPENLKQYAENTIVDREELIADIEKVRQGDGVSIAKSEVTNGLVAVAVPLPVEVFGQPAGIGCAGPLASDMDTGRLAAELERTVSKLFLPRAQAGG